MKIDDLNWLKAFENSRNGDRTLIDSYVHMAYNEIVIPTLKAKTNSKVEIIDLANEVMAKFWERFYVLGEPLPYNINGYIYTMAMNKAFQHNKLNAKLRVKKLDLDGIRLKDVLTGALIEDDLSGVLEKEAKFEAMEKAIKRLCQTCRKIIIYSFIEKRKLKDCHLELGIPTANAASKKKVKCLNKLIGFAYQELNESIEIQSTLNN